MITANTSEYDAAISKSTKEFKKNFNFAEKIREGEAFNQKLKEQADLMQKLGQYSADFYKRTETQGKNSSVVSDPSTMIDKLSAFTSEIKKNAEAVQSMGDDYGDVNAQMETYNELVLEQAKRMQFLAELPKEMSAALRDLANAANSAKLADLENRLRLEQQPYDSKKATEALQLAKRKQIEESLNKQRYGVIDEFGNALKPSGSLAKTLDMIHNPQPGRWKSFFLQLANGFKTVAKYVPFSATGRAVMGVAQTGFNAGSYAVRQFGSAIDRLRDSMTTLKALLIGYVSYVLARWFSKVIDANIATLEFSKTIGATAAEVSVLDFAMQQIGHPVEAMRSGLEELQGLLYELELGLPGTVRQFERLGLTAKDFAGKNTAQGFTIIAEKISKISDPAKQAMLAVQLFGDNAKHLLPLLMQGAEGIAKAADKAKAIGLIVDNEKLEKLKEAGIAFDNIKRAIEGIVLQVATKLGPIFGTLIQKVDQWLSKMDMGKMLAGIEDVAIGVITFFIQMYNSIRIVINKIRIEFVTVMHEIKIAIKEAKIAMMELQGADKVQIINARGERMEMLAAQFKDLHGQGGVVDRLGKEIEKFANDPLNAVQGVKDWFKKINKEFADGRRNLEKENTLINLALKYLGKLNLGNKGKDMANSLLYPLEQFQSKMKELKELQKTLLPEEFGRAAVKNINELEEALGASNLRMAGLERVGTAAGVSAINRATMEQENANQSPQARIERLLKQGNMNQAALSGYAKRTAEALENVNVVEFK